MTDLVKPAEAPLLHSQEDRLLAAAAHLSFFAGFWFVAPIAIYALKRQQSRFVAFHALQAALLQVVFGGATMVGAILFAVLGAIAGVVNSPTIAVVLALVPVLLFATAGLLLVGAHLYAAYTAWQGRTSSIPVAGALARGILGADQGAAKV